MLKSRSYAAILLCAALLAGCSGPLNLGPAETPTRVRATALPAGEARPVIIDTDMAADDWVAILYLLRRLDIDVLAITVTGTGEAHCEPGVRNALGLLELAGYRSIPVSCGRETPLQGNHAFPAEWRTGVDSLMGMTLPTRAPDASTPPAHELLASVISSAPEKVTLLTLGPLTNLAEALQALPDLAAKIETVYIMGGAVGVPGNVGSSGAGIANDTAEWNLYVDPHAAAVVFGADVPVTLAPLDVTNQAPVTNRFYERLEKDHNSPEAGFVYELFKKNRDIFLSGGYYFWDSVAAAILADNGLAGFKTRSLRMVEDEGGESGRTVAADDGRSTNVAVSIDTARFEQGLLDTLNGRAP